MILQERQDQFIADMAMFDSWSGRFNYLISLSEELPVEFPEYLLEYRIVGCQSKTCFLPSMQEGLLYITGGAIAP